MCCESCGMVSLLPAVPSKDLEAWYFTGVYRALYHPSEEYTPQVHDKATWAEAERRATKVIPFIEPGFSVLDVGSSTGNFLRSLLQMRPAWKLDLVGIEPDSEHRAFAGSRAGTGGATFYESLYEDDIGAVRYNIITAFHTLEHMSDPVALLTTLRGMLAPGGWLVIEVPNHDDALVAWSGGYKDFYYHPAHAHYFTHRTLGLAFDKAGFKPRNTLREFLQRYGLGNHLKWLAGMENDVPVSAAVDFEYCRWIIKTEQADTLWVTAMKV